MRFSVKNRIDRLAIPVDDVAFLMAFFNLYTLFLSNFLCLFIRMNFVEINT